MKPYTYHSPIPWLFISTFLLTLLLAPLTFSGTNDESLFTLDFKTSAEDSQIQSIIDTTPEFFEVSIDGETHIRFAATVVLKNVTDLIGTNCDLLFDNTKLKVVEIHEAQGDINFDGRANVADVLTLAERFGQSTASDGFSYFDLDASGDSAEVIDAKDIDVLTPHVNEKSIFWTNNPNSDLSTIRESVEIFESPDVSNQNGKIDDIVVVLLPRIHPTPAGFGFDGDARIADIIFEILPGATGEVTLSFEDGMAIDEATEITQTEIVNGSTPKIENIVISLP